MTVFHAMAIALSSWIWYGNESADLSFFLIMLFCVQALSLSVPIQIQTARCATIFSVRHGQVYKNNIAHCHLFASFFLSTSHLHPHPSLAFFPQLQSHQHIHIHTRILQSKDAGSSIASLSQTPVILRSLLAVHVSLSHPSSLILPSVSSTAPSSTQYIYMYIHAYTLKETSLC